MKKLFYLFSVLFAMLFTACEGTKPPTSNKVETGASDNITQTSATLKGLVNVDLATYNSIEFGIMYDSSLEEVNNRSAQMVKASVLQGKDFKVDVTGLTANAQYYYCAYLLLNGMQYEYGAVKEFTTLSSSNKEDAGTPETPDAGTPDNPNNPNNTPAQPSDPDQPNNPEDAGDVVGGTANGHAYVDLGLSVKWATCNVGANVHEEYGDYFAWGETKPKDYYDWSTYKWCNGNYNNLTKYCTESDYGTVDNKTVLDLADDAAHANWGGAWRMPTLEEQRELLYNCTWTWTKVNGVNGYTVTGPNGNSIFLPAAGSRIGSDFDFAGSNGEYWSSSLDTDYSSTNAYYLSFNSRYEGWRFIYRYFGQSVRPVLP